MFVFQKKYFLLTILLFLIELFIGFFVKDTIIRPYGGDLLVVVLLYFLVKSFLDVSSLKIAIGVLVFSYCVEFAQYFKIVELLGLQGNRFFEIIIGTSFHWLDLVAYTLGIVLVYCLDTFLIVPKSIDS